MARFVVLGAGVSGLTCAVCLAEAGHDVEVWSPVAPQETTSVVAGAMWEPSRQEPSGAAWSRTSYETFAELAGDPATGVQLKTAVYPGSELPTGELPEQLRVIRGLRNSRPEELPVGASTGVSATMPLIDMPVYLPYLVNRFIAAGGRLVERQVESFADAAISGALVVNCTGLASRGLAGDATLVPEFGQHVEVTNPVGLVDVGGLDGPDRDHWAAWYPHRDRVVLGGVRITGRDDPTPLPEVTRKILDFCREAEPRLRNCEVLRVRAGLRPVRPVVRVEREDRDGLTVVHDYGHGWAGVTLSWGCARDVVDLCTWH